MTCSPVIRKRSRAGLGLWLFNFLDYIIQFVLQILRILAMDTETVISSQKAHRKRQAGSKLDKKKKKTPSDPNLTARQRNPKAFAYHSVNKVARQVRRLVKSL